MYGICANSVGSVLSWDAGIMRRFLHSKVHLFDAFLLNIATVVDGGSASDFRAESVMRLTVANANQVT